jgi:uncharacterized protein DUF6551
MRSSGTTRTIRLADVVFVPEVNRDVDEKWVKYLVHNWDPTLLDIPKVAAENGHYIPIRGQHRLRALLEMTPGGRVEAQVEEGLSRKEMARQFAQEKVRGVRAFDRFVKLLYAGEPEHVRIGEIVTGAGCHLGLGGSDGAVSCVSTLQKLFSWDLSGAILERVFAILTAAWGHSATNFNGDLVQGVGELIRRFPDVNDIRVRGKLSALSGGALALLGRGRTVKEIQGGTVAGGVAEAVRQLYNRGLRTKGLEL